VSDNDNELPGVSESEIFLSDLFAFARHLHGAISRDELSRADEMAVDAFREWRESQP
jgi:hypothetical protein